MKKTTEKKPAVSVQDRKDAFLPMLLVSVCLAIATVTAIIERFISNFGGELLSPVIAQIIVFFIPTYLCLLLTSPGESALTQLKSIGMSRLRADYIFFIIFSSLFLISTSFLLNVIFGGVYPLSEGFTLLGAFTAGVGEYTVSYPYLIVVYAIFPAIIEEMLFRGLLYSLFSEIGEDIAIILTTVISSLFAFSLGGMPAALLCGFTYCFIRYTTGTLQACMIVHFIFNLYAIFMQTNLSKYFLSSLNNLLLMIIVIIAWLISLILFFAESARIYRAKAARIASGDEASSMPGISIKAAADKIKPIFSHRPTLICGIISLLLFISITVISYFT